MKVDSKNRILVPRHLSQYAGLEKEILVVGMLHFLEIWNPDRYSENLMQIPEQEKAAVYELADRLYAGRQKGGAE